MKPENEEKECYPNDPCGEPGCQECCSHDDRDCGHCLDCDAFISRPEWEKWGLEG